MPVSGETHHVTIEANGVKRGFMIDPGSYERQRADDFAPRIAVGTEPRVREGIWDAWSQTGAVEGIDQLTFSNAQKIYFTDGNIHMTKNETIALDAIWRSADASQNATAPQIIDFGLGHVVVGVGTRVRRFIIATQLWAQSTTVLGADAKWLHRHGNRLFVGCESGADFYRSSDVDTFTQPKSGQKASCFASWSEDLWLGDGSAIKKSSDLGDSWGSAINVGNPDTLVTGLGTAFNVLVIGKEDGIYFYDGSNVTPIIEFPNKKFIGNCRALVDHDGFLHTHVLGEIWKISLSSGTISNLTKMTPIMGGTRDKDVHGHGRPVWMWTGSFYLYVCFDDGENVFPEVLYHNGLGWHQAYRNLDTGTRMRAGGYSLNAGRTYLNDGDTRARRQLTLRDVPFPDYALSGKFETSDFDGDLRFMDKAFRDVAVEVRNIDNDNSRIVRIRYSIDSGENWIQLQDITNNGKIVVSFSEPDAAVQSKQLRLEFEIQSDGTDTPVIESFSVNFLNRPRATYVYSVDLKLNPTDEQRLLDGNRETISVRDRLLFLEVAEEANSPVRFVDMHAIHHLVYITKTSVLQRSDQDWEFGEEHERVVNLVMVDSEQSIWPQVAMDMEFEITVVVKKGNASSTTYDDPTYTYDYAQYNP